MASNKRSLAAVCLASQMIAIGAFAQTPPPTPGTSFSTTIRMYRSVDTAGAAGAHVALSTPIDASCDAGGFQWLRVVSETSKQIALAALLSRRTVIVRFTAKAGTYCNLEEIALQ